MTHDTTMTKPANLLPCPFCGSRDLSFTRFNALYDAFRHQVYCKKCGAYGPSMTSVYGNLEAILSDLTSAWNERTATAPKHRPAEVLTGKDAGRISSALFNANVCIDHLLPLSAVPANPGRLNGGWEELLDELLECDREKLAAMFGESGRYLADAIDEIEEESPGDAEAGALREIFYRIGGWVIMGSYPTISDITLNEQGQFSSCLVHWGIQRTFVVWGKTYKQAIAKAIREHKGYRRRKLAKAREAAGHEQP